MSSLALRFSDFVLPLATDKPASPLPDQPCGVAAPSASAAEDTAARMADTKYFIRFFLVRYRRARRQRILAANIAPQCGFFVANVGRVRRVFRRGLRRSRA